MSYSKEQKEEILRRVKIEDVIKDYISLKPSGNRFKGVCPFHGDKDPSLSVTPEKGFWHCFGCGERGNAIDFLMKIETIDFPEALENLAKRAGIVLRSPGPPDRKATERERLMQIIGHLAEFYHEQLLRTEGGRNAVQYLKKRGLTGATVSLFKIGYAPKGRMNALYILEKKGFSRDEIIKSGMALRRVDSGETVDFFWNRIIIPIQDYQGRYIAMGGRIFEDSDIQQAKYKNSPETVLFRKGKTLFGMHLARKAISRDDRAVIVEGYMDQIMLYQHGIENVVAGMGTSLTADQAKILRKFCSRCVLAYDADKAGQMATVKSIDIFEEAGIVPSVLLLPGGEDPDSMVRRTSADDFIKKIDSAVELVDFQVRLAASSSDIRTPSGKSKFIHRLVAVLHKIQDPIKKNEYIRKVSEMADVKEELVREIMSETALPSPLPARRATRFIPSDSPEEKLLRAMLIHPEAFSLARELISPAEIINAELRRIYDILFSVNPQGTVTAGDFSAYISEEGIIKRITELIMAGEEPPFSADAVRELVKKVKDEKLKLRLKELKKEVQRLLSENNIDHYDERFLEYQRLSQYFKGRK